MDQNNPQGALSHEEAKAIAADLHRRPQEFCRRLLPEWFPKRMPWVHWGMLAILTRKCKFLLECPELDKVERFFVYKEDPLVEESPDLPIFEVRRDENGTPIDITMSLTTQTGIMIPRGFSKTTINNAAVLYMILFQEEDFIVYISETSTHACQQLSNVKYQLEMNPRILSLFGALKPTQRSGAKWSEDFITTTTGVSVAARGRGGQIRGLNINGERPKRIILDDVEDKESVATPEQRLKAKKWFYSDVIPALPAMHPDACIVVNGTLLHSEALLAVLANDPDLTMIRFGALDPEGNPLWPELMDHASLERKKTSFARAGTLSSYYMEYFNTIRGGEDAKFWQGMFFIKRPEGEIFKALAIDPAISAKAGSDSCTIGVVGIDPKGQHYVMDLWGKVGASPREQVNMYFEMWHKWKPEKCGVEAQAYQAALVHLLREEMFRKKAYFEIEEIRHSQKKVERVEGILQPRYANGYIAHCRRFPVLEEQLLDWPNGKMDYPDVIAMAIALLDPYAGFGSGEDSDPHEDQYEPLEDLLDGEWRVI